MSSPTIITTGHNADGLSTFIQNPASQQFSPRIGIIYSSDGQPLDLNNSADIAAFEARDHADLIPKEGSVVLVAEWPPATDGVSKMHRTLSVDVRVMIQGQSKHIERIAMNV